MGLIKVIETDNEIIVDYSEKDNFSSYNLKKFSKKGNAGKVTYEVEIDEGTLFINKVINDEEDEMVWATSTQNVLYIRG